MRLYSVRAGETIIDAAINACGSFEAWGEIATLNDLNWNDTLTAGQSLQVPEVVEAEYYKQLLKNPACNGPQPSDIGALVTTLEGETVIGVYAKPVYSTYSVQYEVKEGETINDVVLNATGSINNLETFLNANNFDNWNPTLTAGQKLNIAFDEQQTNVLKGLAKYPACNIPVINDLSTQIQELINIFAETWILSTGFWNDQAAWVDTASWKDEP